MKRFVISLLVLMGMNSAVNALKVTVDAVKDAGSSVTARGASVVRLEPDYCCGYSGKGITLMAVTDERLLASSMRRATQLGSAAAHEIKTIFFVCIEKCVKIEGDDSYLMPKPTISGYVLSAAKNPYEITEEFLTDYLISSMRDVLKAQWQKLNPSKPMPTVWRNIKNWTYKGNACSDIDTHRQEALAIARSAQADGLSAETLELIERPTTLLVLVEEIVFEGDKA